jgi:heat-inducible transcriptional repressor
MSELDSRKEQVLKAVVTDYTVSAVPVGSQQLAARHFARWSSATIRNELAYLMETGHLRQPHTSSGRVPSDRGYRYFVDFLMEESPLDRATRLRLDRFFAALPQDLEAILEGTALAIAQDTDAVGLVTAPRTTWCRLKHIDLVHLEDRRVLALVVLEGNLVRQQGVELPEDPTQEDLAALSARVNREALGFTHEELRTYLDEKAVTGWQRTACDAIADFMAAYDDQSATVVVHDGVRNLIRQPEFLEAGKLGPVLELLEESRELSRLLGSIELDGDVEVVIGDENPDSHLHDCSLVMTTYSAAMVRGTLGSIGPTRMRYADAVARLRYISRLASDSIGRLYS